MNTCSLGLTSSAQAHPGKLLLSPEGSPALLCALLVPSSEDFRSCPLLALPQCRAPSGASTTRSRSCISRARDDPTGAGGSYQHSVILIGSCAVLRVLRYGSLISNRRVSPSLMACLSNTYRSSRLSRPCPFSRGSTLLKRTSP